MSGAIGLRKAGAGDLEILASLVLQLFVAHEGDPDDHAAAHSRAAVLLDSADVHLFERAGAVIGYAALHDMGDCVFVRHFLIERQARGGGTGRAAYRALEAACFPGRRVRLDVSMTLAQPRAFWEAMGFTARAVAMEHRGAGA